MDVADAACFQSAGRGSKVSAGAATTVSLSRRSERRAAEMFQQRETNWTLLEHLSPEDLRRTITSQLHTWLLGHTFLRPISQKQSNLLHLHRLSSGDRALSSPARWSSCQQEPERT